MTIDERLQYCKICLNRKMDFQSGLVCSLTGQKPAFEPTCPDFRIDQPEADRLVQLEKDAKEEEAQTGMFATEKSFMSKGIIGGVLMIVAAIVWFVVGLWAGYIYFYPPVLLVIGIVAIVRGMRKGSEKV